MNIHLSPHNSTVNHPYLPSPAKVYYYRAHVTPSDTLLAILCEKHEITIYHCSLRQKVIITQSENGTIEKLSLFQSRHAWYIVGNGSAAELRIA